MVVSLNSFNQLIYLMRRVSSAVRAKCDIKRASASILLLSFLAHLLRLQGQNFLINSRKNLHSLISFACGRVQTLLELINSYLKLKLKLFRFLSHDAMLCSGIVCKVFSEKFTVSFLQGKTTRLRPSADIYNSGPRGFD
jgi:hypothetical protein